MKDVFKILSLFVVISMLIVACSEDDEGDVSDPCEAVTCATGEECQNGTCVDTTTSSATCEACGSYDGDVNSGGDSVTILLGAGVGLDNEVLDDTPFAAEVEENPSSSDSLDMDVSLEVNISGLAATVPLSITVHFDAATGVFTAQKNKDYSITITNPLTLQIEAKVVDFSGTYNSSTEAIEGQLVLDDPSGSSDDNIDATFYFTGSKQ